jgi:hypothetical protein
MTKDLRISSYIRKPFLIYDFATPPPLPIKKAFQYVSFRLYTTLIKKKRKYSSYIGKFRWDRVGCKVIFEESFLIYEEFRKYLIIYEKAVSHI